MINLRGIEKNQTGFSLPLDADNKPILINTPLYEEEFFSPPDLGLAQLFIKEKLINFADCPDVETISKNGQGKFNLGGVPYEISNDRSFIGNYRFLPQASNPYQNPPIIILFKNIWEREWQIILRWEKMLPDGSFLFKELYYDKDGNIFLEERGIKIPVGHLKNVNWGDERFAGQPSHVVVSFYRWSNFKCPTIEVYLRGGTYNKMIWEGDLLDKPKGTVSIKKVPPEKIEEALNISPEARIVGESLARHFIPSLLGKKAA